MKLVLFVVLVFSQLACIAFTEDTRLVLNGGETFTNITILANAIRKLRSVNFQAIEVDNLESLQIGPCRTITVS